MIKLFFNKFKEALTSANASPRITSASFATGLIIALGPLPGTHIICALLLVKFSPLKPLPLMAGVMVHNPWTMVPIHLAGLMLGDLILYGQLASLEAFSAFPWEDVSLIKLFTPSFWQHHGDVFAHMVKPFLLGSTLMAAAAGALSYALCLGYLRRFQRRSDRGVSNG